jgi:hypothetical protein
MTATTAVTPQAAMIGVQLIRDGQRTTVHVTGERYGPLAVTPGVEVTPAGAVQLTGWWRVTHCRTGMVVPTPEPMCRPCARRLVDELLAQPVSWDAFDTAPTVEAWHRAAPEQVRARVLQLAMTAGDISCDRDRVA